MRAGNQRNAIVVVEGLGDVLAEGITSTTGGDAPSAAVIGVGPEEIAHGSLVRNLLDAVEGADVVQGIYAGGKSSVKTENLAVNQGGQGKIVE